MAAFAAAAERPTFERSERMALKFPMPEMPLWMLVPWALICQNRSSDSAHDAVEMFLTVVV